MSLTSSLIESTRDEVRNSRRSLPTWRRSLSKAQALMSNPEASIREISAFIESDPTLTARVLGQANSAAYAGVVKIRTVERAIVRLGLDAVRNFFLTGHLKHVLDLRNPVLREIYTVWWKHSLACAMLCRSIAAHVDKAQMAQEAYTIGLLHDVGVVVLLQALEKLCQGGDTAADLDSETACEIVRLLHCDAGRDVLLEMGFSADVVAIAETHEDAEEREDPDDVLLSILVVSNALLRKVGLSLKPQPGLSVTNLPAAGFLGLDPVFIASQEVEIEDALEHLNRMVG